nr:unnamed protein product [uncultured bacterium]
MNGASADNLNKLAQGLSSLAALKDVKISSSIGNQITSIGQAVRSIGGVDFSPLTSLANSLAPLSTIGKSNLNSFISQLSRLPQALKGMKDVDFDDITTQIQKLSAAMSPLAAQMQQIASGFASLPKNIKAVVANTNILAQSNDVAAKSYTNLAAKLATVWIALKTTMKFLASCVNKSNEYVESLNLFTVSMGEFAEEAQAYAETVAEVMGIDPSTWLKNQGVFMTLATGFGVISDRAYIMSQNLTQLGYDLSSFFNLPVEETMQKIQSGMDALFNSLEHSQMDRSLLTGEKFMAKHLNIGDQVAQVAGIAYPIPIDNYIKIVRGVKFYGRYIYGLQ